MEQLGKKEELSTARQMPLTLGCEQLQQGDEDKDEAVAAEDDMSLPDAMAALESTMTQLAQLALFIRRAGTVSRLAKADRSFDPNDHADFRLFLLFMLLVKSTLTGDDSGRQSKISRLRLLYPTESRQRIVEQSLALNPAQEILVTGQHASPK